jgi:preprotein translocase subunit SecE
VTTDALASPKRSWLGRVVDFLRDVRGEVRKVTWPTWPELKKATGVIIVFVITLGVLIGLMDSFLQLVFVTAVAKLF